MRLIEGRDLWDIPNIENDSRDLHSLVMLSVHDGPFNRSFVRLCQRIWGVTGSSSRYFRPLNFGDWG